MRYFITFLLSFPLWLLSQDLTESTLPIIVVETNGEVIIDEPKINAEMKVYYKGPGQLNKLTDTELHYDGQIGIEVRGQTSSSLFPKKGYGIETRDADGENLNIELLDYPKENDWVINSPYSDKSLIRNAMAYSLAGEIMSYAPRVKFAELIINGAYQGVVLFTEKIKVDKNRVDITKSEKGDITGGYMFRFDKFDSIDEIAWVSEFKPSPGRPQETRFIYSYPKVDDITIDQKVYIKNWMTEFESVLASNLFAHPTNGYHAWINSESFVDFILVNEIAKNVDAYRLSTYFYKDRDSIDSRLHAGPVWDFNLAFGNANYCEGGNFQGWALDFNIACPDDFWLNHFWWRRLFNESAFQNQLYERWESLREDIWSNESLLSKVDALANQLVEPRERNFERWPILNEWIWPNNFVGGDYQSELNYLKDWLIERVAWIDKELSRIATANKDEEIGIGLVVYPVPSNGMVEFYSSLVANDPLRLDIYDAVGRKISSHDFGGYLSLNFDQKQLYFYNLVDNNNKLLRSGRILIN